MTDDFDVSLRRRLESLATAVPVAPPGAVSAVVRQPVRPRSTSRLALAGLLPVLSVVVIGAVVATVLKIGPGPSDSSSGSTDAANGPIESTTRSGDFELTVRSAKGRYAVDEPIDIDASLTYRGGAPVQIAHAMGAAESPLGFGIEEAVLGDLRITPTTQDACVRSTLEPGRPLIVAFAKSGGWSGDDPRSADYRAFMQDPVLRLGSGTWHVYALASFSIGECAPGPIERRVDLAIVVDGTLAPIDSPVVATHATTTAAPSDPNATPRGADQLPLTTFPREAAACEQSLGAGVLAINGRTGLGFVVEPGEEVDVTWPYGWSAHREDGVAVLVDASGRIVAREGERITAGGGWGEGTFRACELDPWAGTPMELASAREPAKGCYTGFSSGVLGRSPVTGLGIVTDSSIGVAPVRWPFEYSARDVHGLAVLFDPDDRIVAWEGGRVGFSGPGAPDGALIRACGEVIRIADAVAD